LPHIENPKIGVATLSGALGVMTLDAVQHTEVELENLSAQTKKGIEAISPPWLKISNPIDIWPAMMFSPKMIPPLVEGLNTLLSDWQLGAVVFIGAAFDEKWAVSLTQFLTDLANQHPDKALVCCLYGPYGDEAIKKLQEAGRVVAYPTPERAIRALARVYEYSLLRGRL
jgi:acyl-CoA synthetase (NDP forming)